MLKSFINSHLISFSINKNCGHLCDFSNASMGEWLDRNIYGIIKARNVNIVTQNKSNKHQQNEGGQPAIQIAKWLAKPCVEGQILPQIRAKTKILSLVI